MDEQLLKLGAGDDSSNKEEDIWSGCTANVCLITESQIFVANSGDSRSILVRKDVLF